MMQLNKKTIGVFIAAIFTGLFFFSKTLYTYNLPEVTGTKPKRGTLTKLEISSGIAGWAEMEYIYAAVSGTVSQVLVQEGETVTAGQRLFEMAFDTVPAERKLEETRNTIRRLEGEIQNMTNRLHTIREALSAAETAPLLGYGGIILMDINKARLELKNAQTAFELGFQSRKDMLNAEHVLKTLVFKYETEKEELEYTLGAKRLDLNNLLLAEEACLDILAEYRENAVITALTEGIVVNLPVEKGRYVTEHTLLGSIGIGKTFTVTCSISLDNNFVSSGDTCELSNTSHVLTGTVIRVKPSEQGKTVTISLVSDEASEGETFDIAFEKNSAASFTLVPSSAVNQDNDGYFIYQIKRRKGIMGEEYYLERLTIFIGDSDYQYTAVIRGITFFEPVVLVSSKALSSGITIALKNPEDFFES